MSNNVDVLAVMDDMYQALPILKCESPLTARTIEQARRLQVYLEARAAVAELIDVASDVLLELRDKSDAKNDLIAVLYRVRGEA